jgi:hypothetical protein
MSPSRFLLALYIIVAPFLTASVVFAEESHEASSVASSGAPSEPRSDAGTEAQSEEGEAATPLEEPTETPVSTTEDIQPLDHWLESGAEESSSPVEIPAEGLNTISGDVQEEPTPTPTPKYQFPIVGAEHVMLKKAQKERLDKVEKKLRSIVYKEQQARLQESLKDPRGDVEIRICSVNFNGYGTKEENERLLKKIPKPRIAKAERTILKAIVAANCNLVAVQGIIGRSPAFATEALTAFATKLSKKTNKIPWKSEIARSKEQNGYQGFLIKDSDDSPIDGFQVETITNAILKVPGKPLRTTVSSKNDTVPRDFLKITLEVKSKDSLKPDPMAFETKPSFKPTRQVVIINGILAKGVAPYAADESLLKLQIADVATRLFDVEQSKISPNQQPIVLAAIERVEGVLGGAEHILTGRLTIDDFEKDGLCQIVSGITEAPKIEGEEGEEEVKKEEKPKPSKVVDFTADTLVECKSPIERPKVRFDLLASVAFEKKPAPEEEASVKKQKISLRDLELQTEGIFVVTADLKYTAKKGSNMLNSSAGRIEIANGLSGAYLVWVDLNW